MRRPLCKEDGCTYKTYKEYDVCNAHWKRTWPLCTYCKERKMDPTEEARICYQCEQPRCEVDGCRQAALYDNTICNEHNTTACPNHWCSKRVGPGYTQCYNCNVADGYIMNTYGITLEEALKMYDKQRGRCDIKGCRKHIKFSWTPDSRGDRGNIDHCHDKGHVRGLLCSPCNTGLGMFKDNTKRMQGAIDYLLRT